MNLFSRISIFSIISIDKLIHMFLKLYSDEVGSGNNDLGFKS